MRTSYFAKYRYLNLNNGISIALSAPIEIETYPDLFPTWKILSEYKKTKNKEKYIQEYNQILNKLDPQKVYDDLKDKTILCWESSEKFCHRHLVANWLREKLGVKIKEI